MKTFEVSFRPLAEADLLALYRHIAVFQVRETEVLIVRIFYGGQDYERALHGKRGDWVP